jgi:hypothetical protein
MYIKLEKVDEVSRKKISFFFFFWCLPCFFLGCRRINADFAKLLICIVIDIIGASSELIPILGEVSDVVWAPIAALLLRSLYGSNILFVFEFAEEILPFTDILPLATIW